MSKPFSRFWPFVALVLVAVAVLLWRQGRPRDRASAKRPTPVTQQTAEPPAMRSATKTTPAAAAVDDEMSAALTAALKQADPRERSRQFSELLQRWIQRDPEAVLAYVRTMPRGSEYSQALLQTLHAIGRRDADRALTLARDLIRGQEELPFYSGIFFQMAQENLPGAIERLALVPAGEARIQAVRALVDVWTRTDFEAAFAWAQQLPDAAMRNTALESVFNELSARDPLRAIELAQKSLTGASRSRAVSRAVQILTSTDPARASELVGELPPGDLQGMAAVTVAHALASRNIETALEWVKTLAVDYTRWTALNGVLSVWAQKDQAAAARYVLDMPPGQPLEFAARHLAFILASNPRDAILWAEALPSDGARAAAHPMIASAWAQRAPPDAVRWAASLRENPQRADALTAAFSYWMLMDPKAAQAWLETADIDLRIKAQFKAR